MNKLNISKLLTRFAIIFGVIFMGVFLVSCKDKTPDDPIDNPIISNQSLADIYSNLLIYQERLEQLTANAEPELSNSTNILLSTYEYATYTRQELLNTYLGTTHNLVEDHYMEQLLTTKDFVGQVRLLIADDLDQEIGVAFHPNPIDSSITFRFLLSNEGYIVIDATYGIQHTYVKIGMSFDKLEYYELHYNYEGDFDPLDNQQILYNYFTFNEGVEAAYINSLGDYFTLNYTSIENHTQFMISAGATELGLEEGGAGYHVSIYDSNAMTRTNLTVVDGQIESEIYEVFSEHGLFYVYTDHPIYGDEIILTVNFIEADGWDHLIVAENNGGNAGELDGIYDAQNNALYSGRIRLTYTPTYAYAAIDQFVPHGTLNDSHFNLSNYGINLNNNKATLAYFSTLKVTNFNNIKQSLVLDDLDFFVDDIETELYNYLDLDIIACIEGTNDPIQIDGPTGDGVEEFETFMTNFYDAYEANPELIQTENGAFSIFDSRTNNTTIVDSQLSMSINQEAMYLNVSSFTLSYGSYTIMERNGKFFEFDKAGGTVDYRSISDEVTMTYFMQLLSQNTSVTDPMKGIVSVTKDGQNSYRVVMNINALGLLGDYLLDSYSFYGFQDTEIIATYTFDTNHTHFIYTIDITGLVNYEYYVNPRATTYHGQGEVRLANVDVINPVNENDTLYLTSRKQDILYEIPFGFMTRYVLHEGNNYAMIYLEAGGYRVQNIQYYDVDVTIENDYGQVSVNNGIFTASQAGYYYIVINSEIKQSTDLYVFAYTPPAINESVFDSDSGTFSQEYVGEEVYYINIPESNQHRILVISLDSIANALNEEDMFSIQADPYEVNNNHMCVHDYMFYGSTNCYFEIKSEVDVTLQIDTNMAGLLEFEYEFVTIDPELSTIYDAVDINDLPYIILTAALNEVRVNFTISEERTYDIIFNFMMFDTAYVNIDFYRGNGSLIDDHIWEYSGTLEVGEYYILFDSFNTPDITVIVETTIN